MHRLEESKINEIRNAADIVSVISDYIPLKMQGKNYFGVCPFHDDHSPSMSVSKEKQLFKCFVCNKGGNVFTFVKDYENIRYIEAVKRVADKVGIPLQIDSYKKEDNKYKLEFEIMEFATKIMQNNLNSSEGNNAREYLNNRNITDSVIKDFRIGLTLPNNHYLYDALSKKYDVKKLEELGLINIDGLSGYDKFVNRIMIPITNLNGEVVGYTGRIYNGEDAAKYINTKETIIYKKGNILFNYHNAKNYIRDEKCVILVEGNMDAIRLHSSGIRNVLALMGTAITKEQIQIIKKLRVPVVLVLDSDDAGELATINVGEYLTNENIIVKVVRLNGAKDPDEYIVKNGVDAFRETVKYSVNYFDYRMNTLKNDKNLNNTEELVNYLKQVARMLSGKDDLTKEVTLKKISEEYNVDYEVLKREVEFGIPVVEKEVPKTVVKNDKYSKLVRKMFGYLMSDAKYIKIFNKQLGFLKNKEERDLVVEIETFVENCGTINVADFLSYIENYDNLRELVNTIISDIDYDELNDEEFMFYITQISDILDKEEINRLKKMQLNCTDILEKIEIGNKIQRLVKKRSEKNGGN